MSLYTDIMELLKTRKVINAEWLAPLYVCSIGCHIFNIFNKKKHVLRDGELISDARSTRYHGQFSWIWKIPFNQAFFRC